MSRSPTAEALLHPFFHLLEQACHDGRQPLVPSSTRDVAALDEHEVRRQRTRTIRLIESPLRPDVPRSCTVFRGFKWLIRAQGDPSFMLARTAQSPVRGLLHGFIEATSSSSNRGSSGAPPRVSGSPSAALPGNPLTVVTSLPSTPASDLRYPGRGRVDAERRHESRLSGRGSPAAAGDETIVQSPVAKRSPSPHFCNDFFGIGRSKTAGWGAFAERILHRGDVILRETPLMVADSSSLFSEFYKLDPPARQLALSLHANELAKPGTALIRAVWATNCFTVGGQAEGLFPIAARFNHACHPAHNVDFAYDHVSRFLVLVVRAEQVAAGEELRICYGKDRTAAELYTTYGFQCQCEACPGLSDMDVWTLTSQW